MMLLSSSVIIIFFNVVIGQDIDLSSSILITCPTPYTTGVEFNWYRNAQLLKVTNESEPLLVEPTTTPANYWCEMKMNETTLSIRSSITLIQKVTDDGTKNEICYQPKNRGSGTTNYVKRYYYNFIDEQCLPFVYLGNHGNQNQFITKEACEKVCPAEIIEGLNDIIVYKEFDLVTSSTTTDATTADQSTSVASTTPSSSMMTTAILTTTRDPEDCSHEPNTVYKFCGFCQKTCDHYGLFDIDCPPDCVEGCFCDRGFNRNSTGQCVPENDCRHVTTKCHDVRARYYDCAPICHSTCAERNLQLPCHRTCQHGCFCQAGYFFDQSGVCVPADQCPVDAVVPQQFCSEMPTFHPTCTTPEEFFYYDINSESCISTTGCSTSSNKFTDPQTCYNSCSQSCPGGKQKPVCQNDPCVDALNCTGVVNATCVTDRCNGCNAYKYIDDNNRVIPNGQCGISSETDLCKDVTCGHCRKCVMDGHTATCGPDLESRHCQDPCQPNPCKKCEICVKNRVHCYTDPCNDHRCESDSTCDDVIVIR